MRFAWGGAFTALAAALLLLPHRRALVAAEPLKRIPQFMPHKSLPAVKVDRNAQVTYTQVVKQDLLDELECALRDLRVVDPAYPHQFPTFMARKAAIMMCIENIRAVVRRNEVLVFSPYQASAKEFIQALAAQLGQASEGTPFENVVLEAALGVTCTNLFNKLNELSPAVTTALDSLRPQSKGLDIIQTRVDELLPLKNRLDELLKTVQDISRSIHDVLDNEHALKDMHISQEGEHQKVETEQADDSKSRKPAHDLELLFDNYLMQIEWLASEIQDLLNEITNTEENIELHLDLLRNRILKFELSLSIASFVVACGALITGLFGMNLLSHFEHHTSMFYVVSALIAGLMYGLLRASIVHGRQQKLF